MPSTNPPPLPRLEWLSRLTSLNVAASATRGLAPHKPLLLFSIMDMVDDGSLTSPNIVYSAELFFRFQCYWQAVIERQRNRPDMRLPFHALGGARDRLWVRFSEDGNPSVSKDTTRRCRMDEGLWQCLQQEGFRREARQRLIARYFAPKEQIALCAQLKLPEPTTAEVQAVRRNADSFRASQRKGRDARFRSMVLLNYRFTCALTGYSLNTNQEHMVEAAHIHQHSLSGNDDPRNGLALTPDAHWMFDRGLWTAVPSGDVFIVAIAKGRFTNASPAGRTLMDHHEKPLVFPQGCAFKPDPQHFAWHRTHRFLGDTPAG